MPPLYLAGVSAVGHVVVIGHEADAGTWTAEDLTVQTGSPPSASTRMTTWAEFASQHLSHVSPDGRLHEHVRPLMGGVWAHNDLTGIDDAPLAAIDSPLTSWVDGRFQHLVYLGTDAHVHELYYDLILAAGWKHNDLTALVTGPGATNGALVSWVDTQFQHVAFVAADGHVYELYYDVILRAGWKVDDLTARTSSPAAAVHAPFCGWVDPRADIRTQDESSTQVQHVVYVSDDGHIHHLCYDLLSPQRGWAHEDLTATVAGVPVAEALDGVSGCVDGLQRHVFFQTTDGRLHRLRSRIGVTPSWECDDVAIDAPNGAFLGFSDLFSTHVLVKAADGVLQDVSTPTSAGTALPTWTTTRSPDATSSSMPTIDGHSCAWYVPLDLLELYRLLRAQLMYPHPTGLPTEGPPGFAADAQLAGWDHVLSVGPGRPTNVYQQTGNIWAEPGPHPHAPPTNPIGFGDNPLMNTGKLLIALSVESMLGHDVAGNLASAALDALHTLRPFSGTYAGYPLRWDPASAWDWSDRDPMAPDDGPLGRRAREYLIDDSGGEYVLCTPRNDWRTARAPSTHEWSTWDLATREGWGGPYQDRYRRYRDWDPSCDEIVGLLCGAFVASQIAEPAVATSARGLLADLATYFAASGYTLVRPGGDGFASRGPAIGTIAGEWVFNRVFDRVLGDPHVSPLDTEGVLRAAGAWMPISTTWTEYSVASFLLGASGLPAVLVQDLEVWLGLITLVLNGVSPASVLAATSPLALGQAAAILQNLLPLGCVSYSQAGDDHTPPAWDAGNGTEIAAAHLLRQMPPIDRLKLYFQDYASARFTSLGVKPGYSLGFTPFLGLCGVGDEDRTTRDNYLDLYDTKTTSSTPAWGGVMTGGVDQGAFHAGVALLLAADPVSVAASDVEILQRERELLAQLDRVRRQFRANVNRLPLHNDNAHPAGSEPVEVADPALDYLVALSMAWWHATRRTAQGTTTTPGFPTPPGPADLALEPAVTIESKWNPPFPTPRARPDQVLVQRITVAVGPLDGDVDTGLDVGPLDDVAITASGTISSGVIFGGLSGPDGWDLITDNGNYPLAHDSARRYGLIGRMGFYGAYFRIGATFPRRRWYLDATERLFLSVNTDNHGVGSGQFSVEISRWSAPPARQGRLWHTIRTAATGAWSALGSIEAQEQNHPGPFDTVAVSGADDAPQLHVVGLVDGHAWHTIRSYTGAWQTTFGDVGGQLTNVPAQLTAVACAATDESEYGLQVVSAAGTSLHYAVRNSSDGSWKGYIPVPSALPASGSPIDALACAAIDYDLHVLVVTGGQLLYTQRVALADGADSWQSAFGPVFATTAGDPGMPTSVGCAGVADELHVVVTVGGTLWHTIRHADGSWVPFETIETHEGNYPGPFASVSCAGATDGVTWTLHVAGVTGGQIWHTLRDGSGTWQAQFGNVSAGLAFDGPSVAVAAAAVGSELHLVELV